MQHRRVGSHVHGLLAVDFKLARANPGELRGANAGHGADSRLAGPVDATR